MAALYDIILVSWNDHEGCGVFHVTRVKDLALMANETSAKLLGAQMPYYEGQTRAPAQAQQEIWKIPSIIMGAEMRRGGI